MICTKIDHHQQNIWFGSNIKSFIKNRLANSGGYFINPFFIWKIQQKTVRWGNNWLKTSGILPQVTNDSLTIQVHSPLLVPVVLVSQHFQLKVLLCTTKKPRRHGLENEGKYFSGEDADDVATPNHWAGRGINHQRWSVDPGGHLSRGHGHPVISDAHPCQVLKKCVPFETCRDDISFPI